MVQGDKRFFATALFALVVFAAFGAQVCLAEEPGVGSASGGFSDTSAIALAAALVVSASCVAAAIAVARVGAAALGAASERPELLMRSLIFVVVAEGIAIYGLIIGIMLWTLIKK